MRVIFTTCGPGDADGLASRLVDERLVGCVNLLPGVRSIFHWQGEVCREEEVILIMETAADRVDEATERLRALHPYDVPKIVVLAPEHVNAAYREWLCDVVAGAGR